MVNTAYKHLETRLKFADMTIGQWAGMLLGVVLAFVWGFYVSPLGTYPTLFTAVYVGGVPAMLAYFSSQSEFDLWLRVRALRRWRMKRDRYVPGIATTSALGYVLSEPVRDPAETWRDELPDFDFTAAWD